MRLKAKGLQNFASIVGGAAVFSSLAQLPEPYQSFTSEISLSIGRARLYGAMEIGNGSILFRWTFGVQV